ncbi:MAG: RNA polymerase sigma factor [Phycisphaerales bacterium]|nr:RNA polymerase sigma factor [Phycisphaerales bacterium]
MSEPFDRKTLERLLKAAARGDETAWLVVVEHFTPRLFGFLRAQCGDAELSEEIAQETFCTVARKLESYTEVGRFESWMYRIAKNKLVDEKRRQKRHALPVDFPTLTALAGSASTEDDERNADRLVRLRESMEKLTDADRRILHLYYVAELSFKQIADLLDEPLGTVLARKHRAIRKLGDLIGPDEEGAENG